MSIILEILPSFYNPLDRCFACKEITRVYHLENFKEPSFCCNCLGMKWAGQVNPVRFAELSRSYQRHTVANHIENFQPITIEPNGAKRLG